MRKVIPGRVSTRPVEETNVNCESVYMRKSQHGASSTRFLNPGRDFRVTVNLLQPEASFGVTSC